jgi:hypothetical protein
MLSFWPACQDVVAGFESAQSYNPRVCLASQQPMQPMEVLMWNQNRRSALALCFDGEQKVFCDIEEPCSKLQGIFDRKDL